MNEFEWKKARDPEAMLAAVQDRLSPRKWVLLNCAVARRMADAFDPSFKTAFIDRRELEWSAAPTEMAYRDYRDMEGDSGWSSGGLPPTHTPKDLLTDFYQREARGLEYRNSRCRRERYETISEFLSYFPMFINAEAWPHSRPVLSTVLYSTTRAELYAAAEKQVLGFIRKKARTQDTPATREEATAKVRSVQKQVVLDINKAMRNYAKPANELLAHFLHEQLGNPFQPYEFDPAWRTTDVMGLAKSIEADRGFDRMNMLADALMEAGCEQEGMLLHLQEEREHQRGCWVLDLILGHDVELFARPPIEDVSGTGGRHEPLGLAEPRNWDV